MTAIARNLPRCNQFTDAGALLAAGRIKLYETGTSTPKVAYKDPAKSTSYGSTIDLDAAGLPDDGIIYWDGLYKVEFYSNDGDGTYTLIDTVDPWGELVQSTGYVEQIPVNGSFETDSDSDGDPDNWTITDSGAVVSLDTTDPQHGGNCLLFTNSQNSNDYATSGFYSIADDQKIEIEFLVQASNANANPQIVVQWYDKDQSSISNSTIYDASYGSTPTSYSRIHSLTASAPATACYYKLQVIGNASATQYTVRIDGLRAQEKREDLSAQGPVVPVGLELSRDAGDTSHDINVTAGYCLDSTYTHLIELESETTKQGDAAFAAGDDAGGLTAGSSLPAQGCIYVYAVKNTNTGECDVILESNDPVTGPTLPTNYDVYRYLGAWRTDASNNLEAGLHKGDYFNFWGSGYDEISDTLVVDATWTEATIAAPPYSIIFGYIRSEYETGETVSDTVTAVRTEGSSYAISRDGLGMEATDIINEFEGPFEVQVSSTSKMEYAVDVTGIGAGHIELNAQVRGWHDLLRNNP